jgi:hypothetical protein
LSEYRQSLVLGQATLVDEVIPQELWVWFFASMPVSRPELLISGSRCRRLADLHRENYVLISAETGMALPVSTTYTFYMPLTGIWGYIKRLACFILFLDLIQCVLKVGNAVHHT